MTRYLLLVALVTACADGEPDVMIVQVPGDASEPDAGDGDAGAPTTPDAGDGDAGAPADAGDGDGNDDAGDPPIIVGPGPDAGAPTPYFELACPSECTAVPDPEKPDVVVETGLCYSWAEGVSCTFYCTEYIPAEDHWVGDVPARKLCASLGGTCVYLDSDGQPVPGDQELTNESEYCLPPGAPGRATRP